MTTVVMGEDFILADRTHAVGTDIYLAPKLFDFETGNERWIVAVVGEIPYTEIRKAAMSIPDYIRNVESHVRPGVPAGNYYAVCVAANTTTRYVLEVVGADIPSTAEIALFEYVGSGSGFAFAREALRLGIAPTEVTKHVSVLDRYTSSEHNIVMFGDR